MDKILSNIGPFWELLRFAEVNSTLRNSVIRVFEQKYQNDIMGCGRNCHGDISLHSDSALNALKTFRTLIKRLHFYFTKSDELNQFFWDKIVQHCGSTLIEFAIWNAVGLTIETPLPSLEKLIFGLYNLDESWTHINKWFPNVREIEFHHINDYSYHGGKVQYPTFTDRVPHLERICYAIDLSKDAYAAMAVQFLHSNTQIKTLEFRFDIELLNIDQFISKVNWDDLVVTKLVIDGTVISLNVINRLRNLRILQINSPESYSESELNNPELILRIEELEIHFSQYKNYKLKSTRFDIIGKCPKLKKLTIEPEYDWNVNQLFIKISENLRNLPDLTELKIAEIRKAPRQLPDVGQCRKLRRLEIILWSLKFKKEQFVAFISDLNRMTNKHDWKMSVKHEDYSWRIIYTI